jgi:hypothetical protein
MSGSTDLDMQGQIESEDAEQQDRSRKTVHGMKIKLTLDLMEARDLALQKQNEYTEAYNRNQERLRAHYPMLNDTSVDVLAEIERLQKEYSK